MPPVKSKMLKMSCCWDLGRKKERHGGRWIISLLAERGKAQGDRLLASSASANAKGSGGVLVIFMSSVRYHSRTSSSGLVVTKKKALELMNRCRLIACFNIPYQV